MTPLIFDLPDAYAVLDGRTADGQRLAAIVWPLSIAIVHYVHPDSFLPRLLELMVSRMLQDGYRMELEASLTWTVEWRTAFQTRSWEEIVELARWRETR